MSKNQRITQTQKLNWFKNEFRPHFDEWVVSPVQRMINWKEGMPSFLWLICATDWLAGYWFGKTTRNHTKQAYTGYIKAYFPHKYDADGLYDRLRNGIVHMYTIKNRKYALTHQHPEMHLKPNPEGYVLLNLEDFFQDWLDAKEAYFNAVEVDNSLLNKAYNRHKREGFLGLVTVNLLEESDSN